MRTRMAVLMFLIGCPAVAMAQRVSRFEVGPVARVERVAMEAGAGGSAPVAGLAGTFMVSRTFGLEGEITWAARQFERSYEGWFVSFAPPNSTREEVERMAPILRRTLGYRAGMGGTAAVVFRGAVTPRVQLGVRAGLAFRRYLETSAFTILSVPPGVPRERVTETFSDTSDPTTRGGLLFGIDVPVSLTGRLSVVPDVRYVYGGPARIGNKHREFALGLRAVCRF